MLGKKYCGWNVDHDKVERHITLTMPGYVEKLLLRFAHLGYTKVYGWDTSITTIDDFSSTPRVKIEIQPDHTEHYILKSGTYEVEMVNNLQVDKNEVGWFITHPTLVLSG